METLASLASNGHVYMLGMLMNGMTVYGRTASPVDFLTKIDDQHATVVEQSKQNGTEWPDDAEAMMTGAFRGRFEEHSREHQELVERTADTARDEFSEEDDRKAISEQATTLTLAQVTVIPPMGDRFDVELMRVRLAHVAAWWIIPIDVNGTVSFRHGPLEE